MANYAIVRIEKRSMAQVSGMNKHHERLKESYKSNPDIDQSLSHLNYHIVEPEASYRQLILKRIATVGAKRRKNSVVMQDGLITASPDWISNKTTKEQREFFDYAFDFIKERYGSENIFSCVVHMDEKTPHMHFCFVPITKDGRLSSKEIMGGPKGMTKLQDDFYAYMSQKYKDISRGIPAKVSHRAHLPSYLYKNAADLYAHYDEIVNAVQAIGMVRNAKAKDHALEIIGRYAPEMAKMDEYLKTTEKHVADLERELADKKSTLSMYKAENQENYAEINRLEDQNKETLERLRKLQNVIKIIPPEDLEKYKREELEHRKNERKKKGIER